MSLLLLLVLSKAIKWQQWHRDSETIICLQVDSRKPVLKLAFQRVQSDNAFLMPRMLIPSIADQVLSVQFSFHLLQSSIGDLQLFSTMSVLKEHSLTASAHQPWTACFPGFRNCQFISECQSDEHSALRGNVFYSS